MASLDVRGLYLTRLCTIIHDSYRWSRTFSTDRSTFDGYPGYEVVTTAQALSGDELWVFDGAPGFYVVRKMHSGDYCLIHAAGIYWDSSKDIHTQSNEIYASVIESESRGERTMQSVSLI